MYKLENFRDLDHIAKFLQAKISRNMEIEKIVFDSRNATKKTLFIPLKGEKYDGEKFVKDALKKGAACISVNNHGGLAIRVKNVYESLLKLAQSKIEYVKPMTIFITGSYGKTTIKDMIKFYLGKNCHATSLNENNEFGIPYTVLSMPVDTKYLIVECGARRQGDFDMISKILKCDTFVLTGIAENHIETFGSLEGIEKTKLTLKKCLKKRDNFIDGRKIKEKNYKQFNKLLTSKVFQSIGLNLDFRNKKFIPSKGRGNRINFLNGQIIDHTYNASPYTLISTVKEFSYEDTVLVLGDMAELGDDKDKIHLKVLEQLTNYKIFVTGKIYNRISKKINSKNIVAFNNIKDFPKEILSKMLFEGKNLYFKGSRSSKMESYIEALIND